MVLSGPHPIISCNYHGRLLEAFYMLWARAEAARIQGCEII